MPRSTRTATRLPRRAALAAVMGAMLAAPHGPASADPFLLPMEREGAWTAPDREIHFGASLAIASSLRVEGRDRATALAVTASIGLAKEIYDATIKPRHLGRGASRKDLIADLAGAAAGVLLLAAFDR